MGNADKVILRVLAGLGRPVHATKLVKLVYLVDYLYFQHFGRTLTGFEYMWDHYGPNALGHGIVAEAEKLARKGLVAITQYPNVYGGLASQFSGVPNTEVPEVPSEAEMVIEDVLQQYGNLSISRIVALAKRTRPFRGAAQYSLLRMTQTSPPERTSEGDWEAYQRELQELGTTSLEELKQRYGLT